MAFIVLAMRGSIIASGKKRRCGRATGDWRTKPLVVTGGAGARRKEPLRDTSSVRSAASATSASASASQIEAFAPWPPTGVIGCAASPISAAPLAT